ncbi:MAG TPA: hypothetical protein VG845_03045 [Dehalococcoidia bacterium]|nr:hypothetical protein [Dehalococcoidia bacterium]
MRSPRSLYFAVVALVLLPLLVACDSYAEFTVVNATDEPFQAGWAYTGCPRQNAPPPRLETSKAVEPQGEVVFTNVTASKAACVMIANPTGNIRLYARYEDYARYVIRPDTGTPLGRRLDSEPGVAMKASPGDETEAPSVMSYVLAFALGAGGLTSGVISLRYWQEQRRSRRPARARR